MINYFSLSFLIIAGLIVFLYGIYIMKDSLLLLSEDRINTTLKRLTTNPFKTLLIGIVFTMLIQSSSALTAIVLILVSSHLLDYKKGLIIIIGSNIGTTFTSILISLSLTNYFTIFLIIGFSLLILSKKEKIKLIGNCFIGLGNLFLGLYLIRENLLLLIKIKEIYELIIYIEQFKSISFLSGIIITSLIQSSSATIGIIQEAASYNIISLSSSFLFVLGANIGTTITGLVISIKASKEAKQVALLNFLFNLTFGIIFILTFKINSFFIIYICNLLNLNIEGIIASYHIFFNVVSSILFFIYILIFTSNDKTTIKSYNLQ